MLFATFLNIFFIPILYVLVRTISPGKPVSVVAADAQ
jgi:hypothetical protein